MLSLFADIEASDNRERFMISAAGETITFYTTRSGERDFKQLQSAISNVPPGKIPLIVTAYAESLRPLFLMPNAFAFIAPVSFTEHFPGDERLVVDDESLQRFINNVETNDHYEIIVPAQWQSLQATMRDRAREILLRAATRLKTVQHFGRLWPINFTANATMAATCGDITELVAFGPPTALIMAGPSLDSHIAEIKKHNNIWAADTALPAILSRGIYPQVVFSADAGFASREHFINTLPTLNAHRMTLVCDMLVNPGVIRLPFTRTLTYSSSHPLVQHFCATARRDLTEIINPEGDVGSLMRAVFLKLFQETPVQIYGHDRGHRRRVTHARGTAYFSRIYARQTRLHNSEMYMLRLSRRYQPTIIR